VPRRTQCLCCAVGHTGKDVGLSLQDKIISVETIRALAFDTLDFSQPQAPT
jgi:hypothetical protein